MWETFRASGRMTMVRLSYWAGDNSHFKMQLQRQILLNRKKSDISLDMKLTLGPITMHKIDS